MTEIRVCKADALGEEPVPDVVLRIVETIPEDPGSKGWEERREAFFDAQAEQVMQALASLPQATFHALLVRMLRKRSEFYIGASR